MIGKNRESHLCGYFWKRFGEEVCRSHAGLHRAERMLDRLPTLAHGLWGCIKALLHSFEQMLMLPSQNPPLWPCRAPRFERTILTSCGPVAPYPLLASSSLVKRYSIVYTARTRYALYAG